MKQNHQNIDRLIEDIQFITTNRCSLSEDNIKTLKDVVRLLEEVRQDDSEARQLEVVSGALGQLLRIFLSDQVKNLLDGLM